MILLGQKCNYAVELARYVKVYSHFNSNLTKMSTIICTTSLKFLMAMILATTLVFTMLSWYATKKYYEAQEEQRYRKKTFEIAAVTTGTILIGQKIWAKAKIFLMHLNWRQGLLRAQAPKPPTGLTPKRCLTCSM